MYLPGHGTRILLGSSLLLVVGCGLEAYEDKMRKSQERLQRQEDDNRLLDAPLAIPFKKEKAINLFIRPPRGIGSRTTNEAEPRSGLFYIYTPRSTGGAGPLDRMEVAFETNKAKDFLTNVMHSFAASGTPTKKKRTINVSGRKPLNFDTTEMEEGQHFISINTWQGPTNQVAIVYWVNRAQRAAASRLIDVSLESFGVGGDAGKQRQLMTQSPLQVPPGAK